jgi:hypothetical protein
MLLTLPFASRKPLKESSCFFSVELEEGSSSKGIYVLLSFLLQPTVESLGEFPISHAGSWEIYHETMIALRCLSEIIVRKLIEVHPQISSVALLANFRMRNPRSPVEINLDVNLGNEW